MRQASSACESVIRRIQDLRALVIVAFQTPTTDWQLFETGEPVGRSRAMRFPLVKGRSYVQIDRTKENNNESGWFALRTRHQHENKVAIALECKGIEAFFPTYKCTKGWNDRPKVLCAPLFPGYVFATNLESRRLDVLNTPGVAEIVSVAGVPAEIPRDEIEGIRRTIKSQSNIEPHEYLRSGDAVRVTYGPLAGLEGILVRKRNSLRLVVCIELLGRAAAVEIDGMSLEPARDSRSQALLI
jgi:transcription antitermination factor NusG